MSIERKPKSLFYDEHPDDFRLVHPNMALETSALGLSTGISTSIPAKEGIRRFSRIHFTLWGALLTLFIIVFIGILIWLAVDISQQQSHLCFNASQSNTDTTNSGYVVFHKVAAEPYSGTPQSVLTSVTNVTTCESACTADASCLFFTHDLTNSKCYLYHQNSSVGLQNANAAVLGPTSLKANVFVKNTGRVMETLAVLAS